MSSRPDWSEWILRKNLECKLEQLRKSDSVELKEDLTKGKIVPRGVSLAPKRDDESPQQHFIRVTSGHGATKRELYQNPVSGAKGRGIEKLSPTKTRVHFDPQGASINDMHHLVNEHNKQHGTSFKISEQGVSKEHGSHYVDVDHDS